MLPLERNTQEKNLINWILKTIYSSYSEQKKDLFKKGTIEVLSNGVKPSSPDDYKIGRSEIRVYELSSKQGIGCFFIQIEFSEGELMYAHVSEFDLNCVPSNNSSQKYSNLEQLERIKTLVSHHLGL